MGISTNYVYNGPVHTRDHDPGCSGVESKHDAKHNVKEGSYLYALAESIYIITSIIKGVNTPRGTPGDPQVELKFELRNIPQPL